MAEKPSKKPASPSDSAAKTTEAKTTELAKKLAAAVIREHGLPKEIVRDLRKAGVSQDVIDRIGGARNDAPFHTKGYKKKT